MPTEPRTLRTADFGAFEPELRRAFNDAFHFAWDAGEDSPEEHERRLRFGAIVTAARSMPDPEPTAGVALMRDCYALYLKICAYLNPDDFLRDQLATITASISRIGKKLARLPDPAVKKPQRESPSVLELRSAWTVLENQLRAVDEGYAADSVAEELARLRDAASCAEAQTTNVRALLKELSIAGQNEVVAAEQAKEVRTIAAAVAQVSRELKTFSAKCTPPADDDAKFRAYFERLAQTIPVHVRGAPGQTQTQHRSNLEYPHDTSRLTRTPRGRARGALYVGRRVFSVTPRRGTPRPSGSGNLRRQCLRLDRITRLERPANARTATSLRIRSARRVDVEAA